MFRYNIFDIFILVFSFWIILIPFFFLMVQTDKISIEYNYQDELKQCELDLKNTQPICPKVEVKPTGWFFPFFIGLCCALTFDWLWIAYQRERKKPSKTKQKKQTKGGKN